MFSKKVKFNTRYNVVILVTLLTIVGTFLRFYQLGTESIWGDELYTLMFSSTSPINIWSSWTTDCHPPLFYFLENIALSIGNMMGIISPEGIDIMIRIFPALFGVASIPLTFLVGKELVDENTGVISAAFVTVCDFQLYYSQEARMYSMLLCGILLTVLFFLKAVKTQNNPNIGSNYRNWFLFGIFSGISIWTNFYAIPFIAAMYGWAIARDPKLIKSLNGILISVLTCFAIVVTLIPGIITIYTSRTSIPVWFGYEGLDVIRGVFLEIFGQWTPMVYSMTILMVLGGILLFIKNREKLAFIGFMMGTVLIISIFMSYKMPIVGRYLIPITPFIYILCAIPFTKYCEIFKKKPTLALIASIVLIFALWSPLLGIYYTTYQKEDLKGMSHYLSNITNDGDYVVLLTDGMVLRHYYDFENDNTRLIPSQDYRGLEYLKHQSVNRTMYVLPPYKMGELQIEQEWLDRNQQKIINIGNERKIYVIGTSSSDTV